MGQVLNGFTLELLTAPNPETWMEIGEIVNITPPSYSRAAVPNTTSKDTVERFLPSKLLSVGNPTLSLRFNPADAENLHWTEAANGLVTLAKSGAVKTWRILSGTLSGSPSSVEWEFDAFVGEYTPGQMENSGEWLADLTLNLVAGVTEG